MNTLTDAFLVLLPVAERLLTNNDMSSAHDLVVNNFDYIKDNGVAIYSLSPKEYISTEYMLSSSRSHIELYTQLAIQYGVAMGFEDKNVEIMSLENSIKDHERWSKMHDKEIDKYRYNQMPKNDISEELAAARKRIEELESRNCRLESFKSKIENSLNFI